jgi:hypothetical protein
VEGGRARERREREQRDSNAACAQRALNEVDGGTVCCRSNVHQGMELHDRQLGFERLAGNWVCRCRWPVPRLRTLRG